jgi:hypothetical protein
MRNYLVFILINLLGQEEHMGIFHLTYLLCQLLSFRQDGKHKIGIDLEIADLFNNFIGKTEPGCPTTGLELSFK